MQYPSYSFRQRSAGRSRRLGRVYLVGAGPGDPALLTVAAARLLRRADVVVHDALVGDRILDLVRPEARRIDVGKRCGGRATRQERIHELLIEAAREARVVVRLKGGDPFVFGRGGEEALALREAGVPFRVVPGVTAGVGVSAYAGIPVTHRGIASSVTFVTGHEVTGRSRPHVDWEALARLDGTLVVYMGVGTLSAVAERLVAGGRRSDTPAAVIEWGTIARQRTVSARLDEIAEVAERARIGSPALVVVGDVVALRDRIGWFDRLPLRGRRIVVARTRPQPSRIAQALARAGADVIDFPRLEAAPVPLGGGDADRFEALAEYQWLLFISPAAVRHFWSELASRELDTRALGHLRVASFGAATTAALRRRGIAPEVATRTFDPERARLLLEGHGTLAGQRFLFPRDRGRASPIGESVRGSGALVDEIALFETRPGAPPHALPAPVDVVVLPSSSSVDAVAGHLVLLDDRPRVVAIGPATAGAARAAGLQVDAVAEDHSVAGVVAAVRESLGGPEIPSDALLELIAEAAPA